MDKLDLDIAELAARMGTSAGDKYIAPALRSRAKVRAILNRPIKRP